MSEAEFEPLQGYDGELTPEVMHRRSMDFYQQVRWRRSVREFSDKPVPRSVIEQCLLAAGTAPSGANQQPWHFVPVANPALKAQIRQAAEAEEHEFYHRRAPAQWLGALAPLGTDEHKPFLETAPWLIAIFAQTHRQDPSEKIKHYYVTESVGIATGLLITALHHCGLATLTHTPSPMRFLNELLDRPQADRPFLLLVVGFPSDDCHVPRIGKKSLDEIATFHE